MLNMRCTNHHCIHVLNPSEEAKYTIILAANTIPIGVVRELCDMRDGVKQ